MEGSDILWRGDTCSGSGGGSTREHRMPLGRYTYGMAADNHVGFIESKR